MRYLVIGGVTDSSCEAEAECLSNSCRTIGETLRRLGHSIIICSPFKDSADYWVAQGFSKENSNNSSSIDLHFVDMPIVQAEIRNIENEFESVKFVKIPHPSPRNDDKEAVRYAWLLCQLQALESSQAVIAIGGKIDGAANMLLLLAEAKRKPILPFSFMGGAASQSFHRNRYQIEDRLGNEFVVLQNEHSIQNALDLCSRKIDNSNIPTNPPRFFISYPRARPSEADYVEALLRRRNLQVYRDESDFGAGHAIPNEIEEAIYAANIFIAIWCTEYACSPWCFDELELALNRRDSGKMELWILRVDDTRIVPKRARDLVNYHCRTREELEGSILNLLERVVI